MSIDLIAPIKRHRVLLGFPYAGTPCMGFNTARALYHSSQEHSAALLGAEGSWGNFNVCLAAALNMAASGEITHFAMLHADIAPEEWWLDKLLSEMDRTGVELLSVAVPIKDPRGVTSCGIGNPADRWHPLKRFTMEELYNLPETFDAAGAGFPGYPLLHNDGCIVMDLRCKKFFATDDDGLRAHFDFPRRIAKNEDGTFTPQGESEDWFWSRRLHELGVVSAITRKVKLTHDCQFSFPNSGPWGTYANGDEDTKAAWQQVIEDESGNTVASVVG